MTLPICKSSVLYLRTFSRRCRKLRRFFLDTLRESKLEVGLDHRIFRKICVMRKSCIFGIAEVRFHFCRFPLFSTGSDPERFAAEFERKQHKLLLWVLNAKKVALSIWVVDQVWWLRTLVFCFVIGAYPTRPARCIISVMDIRTSSHYHGMRAHSFRPHTMRTFRLFSSTLRP